MAQSKLMKTGYELESVHIVQSPRSMIAHRSECNPFINICGREVYPVIVSPMGAVTDENNYKVWLDHKFICVVPRTVAFEKRLEICKETFASFSLLEAEKLFDLPVGPKRYVCIDIAHGTMDRLYQVCQMLRQAFDDTIVIMTGNVANPEAYDWYDNSGIDFMRIGVGTGSRCTTSCNVGVHYPTATLIDELSMRKEDILGRTELIMDGGISNFDDIPKCIALGCLGVMSGSIFAKADEACEPIVYLHPDNLNLADAIPFDEYQEKLNKLQDLVDEDPDTYKPAYEKLLKRKPYRKYYGMSTKLAQKITGGSGKKTSEGIIKPIPVEYPIAKWAENMEDYLRSAMSYAGVCNIEQMRRETELIVNLSGDKSFRK